MISKRQHKCFNINIAIFNINRINITLTLRKSFRKSNEREIGIHLQKCQRRTRTIFLVFLEYLISPEVVDSQRTACSRIQAWASSRACSADARTAYNLFNVASIMRNNQIGTSWEIGSCGLSDSEFWTIFGFADWDIEVQRGPHLHQKTHQDRSESVRCRCAEELAAMAISKSNIKSRRKPHVIALTEI